MNEACRKIVVEIQFDAIYRGRAIDYVEALRKLRLLMEFVEAMGNQETSFIGNAISYMASCGQFTQTLENLPDSKLLINGVQGINLDEAIQMLDCLDRSETIAHLEINRDRVPEREW